MNYEGSAGKIKNDNMEDSAFREFLRSAFFCAKSVLKQGGRSIFGTLIAKVIISVVRALMLD